MKFRIEIIEIHINQDKRYSIPITVKNLIHNETKNITVK